jgi:hypothetical protein
MALDAQFEDAIKSLHTKGGLVSVVLGNGVDAPSDWTWHPQVHWIVASQVKRHDIPTAIPPNTRLMLITEHISALVFQPIHDERKRRRLPYMVRKTGDSVADELKRIFKDTAPKVYESLPPAPVEAASNGNGNGHGDPAAVEIPPVHAEPTEDRSAKAADGKVPLGGLKAFMEKHQNLSPALSNAEEGRRLFRLAQQLGVPTTLGSIQQYLSVAKRKAGIGSRPESLAPKHIVANVAIAGGLDAAIASLQAIRERADTVDKEIDDLRKENADLKARIVLMRDAFKDL